MIKPIEVLEIHKSVSGVFLTAYKLLDRYSHIIVNHYARNTSGISKKVSMRLHKGQSVLTCKEIAVAGVAVR